MENQQQTGGSGDMDLGQFFSAIGKFFKNLFASILVGLARIRRVTIENKYAFILLIIGGGVVGVLYDKYVDKKFYESTMILNSDYLNKRIVDNAILKLNTLTAEPGRVGLKHDLQIDDSVAANIVKFEAQPFIEEDDVVDMQVLKEQLKNSKLQLEDPKIIDEVIEKLEVENRHAFEIKVNVYNPRHFKGLEHALVNYFRNNPYVAKRIEINAANQKAREAKLSAEIKRLDTLKFALYTNYKSMAEQNRQGSNNVVLNDKLMEKPMDIYDQTMAYYDDLEDLKKDIYLKPDFEVVDGFAEVNVPASASSFTIILNGILIAVGIGYLIIGLIGIDKHLGGLK